MTLTRNDVLQGTLDLLILKVLSRESLHGWGIAQQLGEQSGDVLLVQQGSLYPALHRLEKGGFIGASWGQSENNRRAKFYALTDRGRRRLGDEALLWRRFAQAVDLVLAT